MTYTELYKYLKKHGKLPDVKLNIFQKDWFELIEKYPDKDFTLILADQDRDEDNDPPIEGLEYIDVKFKVIDDWYGCVLVFDPKNKILIWNGTVYESVEEVLKISGYELDDGTGW